MGAAAQIVPHRRVNGMIVVIENVVLFTTSLIGTGSWRGLPPCLRLPWVDFRTKA